MVHHDGHAPAASEATSSWRRDVHGVALELEAPTILRSHPQGLRMLVPEGNIEITLRRQSRASTCAT
jgi:hypothetical protein